MTFDVSIYRKYVKDPSIDTRMCLSDALDEIERLQRDVDGLTTALADSGKTVIIESATQAEHIAELEAGIRERDDTTGMLLARNATYRTALKKLGQAKRERGKALVEERIAGEFSDWIENQCPHWDIDVEPFCVALDGPCEYREGKCPIRNELLDRAREQLCVEGKL